MLVGNEICTDEIPKNLIAMIPIPARFAIRFSRALFGALEQN
jgi:hypothetical protein